MGERTTVDTGNRSVIGRECGRKRSLLAALLCAVMAVLGGLAPSPAAGGDDSAVRLKDINLGTADGSPSLFTQVGGTLFFAASDGTGANGFELWKTDGTETGTVMVKDINSGPAGSGINSLAALGNRLFFTASDGLTGDSCGPATAPQRAPCW